MGKNISNLIPIRRKENVKITKYIDEFIHGYRSSIGIIGEKGSGKTTLLKHIGEYKNDEIVYIWVPSDIVSNPLQFIKAICDQINYHPPMMQNWKLYAEGIFNYLAASAQKYIFLIDDAHYLTYMKDDLIAYLRSKYQEAANMLMILAVDQEYKKNILSYDKPFYGQLAVIELQPISSKECHAMISSLLPLHDSPIETFVCDYSEGNLRYIHMFSNIALSTITLEKRPMENMDDMSEREYMEIEEQIKSNIRDYLEVALGKNLSPQLKAILKIIGSNENITVTEIADLLFTKTGSITTQLKRLMDKGLVVKSGTNYRAKKYAKLLVQA